VQPLGSFPAFYGTRWFITAIKRALHLYLFRATPMQSTPPNPIFEWSILTLSIHLRLGFPSGLFPSDFLPVTYTRSSSPHSRYMTRPPHPPRDDNSHYTWRSIQIDAFSNKKSLYGEGLIGPRSTPKLENHPLPFVSGCLFNIFAANLQCWRPSFHPQPNDTPCCVDKGTHLTWPVSDSFSKIFVLD
jgi:hypothetical protein